MQECIPDWLRDRTPAAAGAPLIRRPWYSAQRSLPRWRQRSTHKLRRVVSLEEGASGGLRPGPPLEERLVVVAPLLVAAGGLPRRRRRGGRGQRLVRAVRAAAPHAAGAAAAAEAGARQEVVLLAGRHAHRDAATGETQLRRWWLPRGHSLTAEQGGAEKAVLRFGEDDSAQLPGHEQGAPEKIQEERGDLTGRIRRAHIHAVGVFVFSCLLWLSLKGRFTLFQAWQCWAGGPRGDAVAKTGDHSCRSQLVLPPCTRPAARAPARCTPPAPPHTLPLVGAPTLLPLAMDCKRPRKAAPTRVPRR